MSIVVNKRSVDFIIDESVDRLLKRMNYTFPMVIVKVDGTLVTRSRFSSHLIKDGSNIDVIHLTSGG